MAEAANNTPYRPGAPRGRRNAKPTGKRTAPSRSRGRKTVGDIAIKERERSV